MRRLFLIRHGETEFNRRNIVQGGGVDADLNETGQDQGRRFFEAYRHIPFDRVFCTQLKRTYQTVQHFESLGHTIHPVPDLNELNWGILEGAEATEEVHRIFHHYNTRWMQGDLHTAVEKGETPIQGWQRAQEGIQHIIQNTPSGGHALVCAHGRIIRIMLAGILGYGLHRMNDFPHANTALYIVQALPNGRFALECMNDTAHLA